MRCLRICGVLAGVLLLAHLGEAGLVRPSSAHGDAGIVKEGRFIVPKTSAGKRVFLNLRYGLNGALEEGRLVLPSDYAQLGKLEVTAAADDATRTAVAVDVKNPLHVVLPTAWKGASAITFTVKAQLPKGWKGKELGVPVLEVTEQERAVPAIEFHGADPWANLDEVGFDKIREPVSSLGMSALKNEFVTGALALKASRMANVDLELVLPDALKGRFQMRVVGTTFDPFPKKRVYDPIMSAEAVRQYGMGAVFNGTRIGFFPQVLADQKKIVLLWFTLDARGMAPLKTQAVLTASFKGKQLRRLPIQVTVSPVTLPVRNPLKTFCWQWNSSRPADIRGMVEHGINVFWTNHRAAWENGAEFLLYHFNATWRRRPVDDKVKAEIREQLDKIIAETRKLHVPDDCWAINLADEVSDKSVERDLEAARYIRAHYPGVQMYFNPAYGYDADKNQSWTTMKTFKALGKFADIIQPYSWHFWKTSQMLDQIRKAGSELWIYDINAIAARDPAMPMGMLRKEPFLAFKHGCTGMGNYALNAWHGGLPWRHDLSQNHAMVYDNEGLVPSRSYEAFRQGIMEFKRLWCLQQIGWNQEELVDYANRMFGAKTPEELRRLVAELDEILLKQFNKAEKGSDK